MRLALQQAEQAQRLGDVPVGALVVYRGLPLVYACNRTFAANDPTGHAEIVALREAARIQQSPRLTGCTLYVTLEPCCMCVGALVHSRIDRLVYAAAEPKSGAVQSAFELANNERHNHHFTITSGVLADESTALLQNFFSERRRVGKRKQFDKHSVIRANTPKE